MVKSNSNLHVLILHHLIAMAEQHHLIMMSHIIVRNGDCRRSTNGVDKPIPTI
ncbi:hypothetical protein MA16_Dca001626 [Dendrobium catenatum]|uniref:Uncharacterized protein n=1 Tax=Dendrobium catenatum TaxID=906689 RepID=A0A2I0WMY0_9ASPA|nr:hypothetical protein MA16_Dca001626 [Dendrobium catenatum]